jgi:hypothetical protein
VIQLDEADACRLLRLRRTSLLGIRRRGLILRVSLVLARLLRIRREHQALLESDLVITVSLRHLDVEFARRSRDLGVPRVRTGLLHRILQVLAGLGARILQLRLRPLLRLGDILRRRDILVRSMAGGEQADTHDGSSDQGARWSRVHVVLLIIRIVSSTLGRAVCFYKLHLGCLCVGRFWHEIPSVNRIYY